MKAKLLKVPDPIEWDFRGVTPDALEAAAIYEYARTSDKIRETARAWLETKVEGKPLGKLLIDAANKRDRHAIDKAIGTAPNPFETGLPLPLLDLLIDKRPDFPAPWLSCPLEFRRNPRYSRIQVAARADESRPANAWPPPKGMRFTFSRSVKWMPFTFAIEWPGATIDEITADFRRWLAEEAERHPEMKGRGQAGQLQLAPLKDLAALRLSNAGLSFTQVQAMLDCYLKPRDTTARKMALDAGIDIESIPRQSASRNVFNAEEMLPLYQHPPAFSAALKRAKARLKALV